MYAPIGAVPGLCTTASAFLATGSAVLAFLINDNEQPTTSLNLASFFVMLIALFFIGMVPWIVTKPVENEMTVNLEPARKSLATGTLLFFLALILNMLGEFYKEETQAINIDSQQKIQTEIKK